MSDPAAGPVGHGSDPLSDVLRAVRLTGALLFLVEASFPWVVEVPHAGAFAPIIPPRARHVVSYLIILRGSGWAGIPDVASTRFEAGDVLVVPNGDPYSMLAEPDQPPELDVEATLDFFPGIAAGRLPFVCREGGSGSIRLRLSELLFVEVVRRHLEGLPAPATGWLSGLRDPAIGKVLMLLHERPAHAWTLDEPARRACISRAAHAARFTRLVGHPPMHYLTLWRMQVAARLLVDGPAKVAAVAHDVGYGSEAAFSRAFRKTVGVPPAAWRERAAATS